MINKVHKIIQKAVGVLGASETLNMSIEVHEEVYDVLFFYQSEVLDTEFKVTISERMFGFCHRYTFDNNIMSVVDMPRVDGEEGCLPYYYVFLKDFEELSGAVARFCEAVKEYEKRYI